MKPTKNTRTRRTFVNRLLSIFALGGLATKANATNRRSRSSAVGIDPFLGEIAIFPYNFTPNGWASCNGQLLPISQYSALFSLIGTIYGGDGVSTFALPDLRSRVPVHVGTGPGLPTYQMGQNGGSPTTTLTVQNMPSHSHVATIGGDVKLRVSEEDIDTDDITNAYLGVREENAYSSSPTPGIYAGGLENDLTVTNTNTGGSLPVNNLQPFLTVRYCIALQGVYPSQS